MRLRCILFLSLLSLLIITGCSSEQAKQTALIEVIYPENIVPTKDKLQEICKEYDLPASSVYQWKNHLILYGVLTHLPDMKDKIIQIYPEASVKIYDQPFYEFNRQGCENKETAKEWDHIIMTANLVDDKTMQEEYMNYHATQFEKWPEISNGFCKADFQQLLIFRNGRQLMLIISIPKGEDLDELNPKTTEDNPRVDEWNAIMGKYQEGISGTEPHETWVVFN